MISLGKSGFPDVPQIEETICPVCQKTCFEPLSWEDLACGIVPSEVYCPSCGWHYDQIQMNSPDIKSGANALSLSEYRKWYLEKITANPAYNFFDESVGNYIPTPHPCPVCGKYQFPDKCCYQICPECGWEDDGTEDTDIVAANDITFTAYRDRYLRCLIDNPGNDISPVVMI